jgi:colicin import membrane protein
MDDSERLIQEWIAKALAHDSTPVPPELRSEVARRFTDARVDYEARLRAELEERDRPRREAQEAWLRAQRARWEAERPAREQRDRERAERERARQQAQAARQAQEEAARAEAAAECRAYEKWLTNIHTKRGREEEAAEQARRQEQRAHQQAAREEFRRKRAAEKERARQARQWGPKETRALVAIADTARQRHLAAAAAAHFTRWLEEQYPEARFSEMEETLIMGRIEWKRAKAKARVA